MSVISPPHGVCGGGAVQRCYLVKWDAGAWIVDDEISTGTELLSALAIE